MMPNIIIIHSCDRDRVLAVPYFFASSAEKDSCCALCSNNWNA